MIYTKPPILITDQIDQLHKRGLIISDEPQAQHYLQNISYYRLAGYWWPMHADKATHVFKPNSRFEDVIALYNFDRELRILLFDVIERIEISLRTKMIYHLSHEEGPWWFEDCKLFEDSREYIRTSHALIGEIERSKDIFIRDHLSRYKNDKRFPPAWKSLEVASFGNLSKLYGNLKPTIKSKDIIAAEFNTVNHTFLPSWLQSIAQIRTICAHHGRLWNKNLPGKPKLLPKPPKPWITNVPPASDHHMLYIHLCCMKYLLDSCNPGNHFMVRLKELLLKYPSVDKKAIGFTPRWEEEALWKN